MRVVLLFTYVFMTILFFAVIFVQVSCNKNKTFNSLSNHTITETPNHQQIIGTQLKAIIPPGYNIRNSCLESFGKAKVIFGEIQGKKYETLKKELFSQKNLNHLDVQLLKHFTLNNLPASLLITNENATKKIMLLSGEKNYSYLVQAYVNKQDEKAFEEMEKFFLSILHDGALAQNLEHALPFSLDEKNTVFKVDQITNDEILYSAHGQKNTKSAANIVVKAYYSNVDALKEMDGPDLGLNSNDSTLEVELSSFNQSADCEVEEIIYAGKTNGKQMKIYQCIYNTPQKTIVFTGYAYENVDKMIDEMIKLRNTLKLS